MTRPASRMVRAVNSRVWNGNTNSNAELTWRGYKDFCKPVWMTEGEVVGREFFTLPVPIPVGAEMGRVTLGAEEFIGRYDGQVWLRPLREA